jgi:hypothetical protein
MLPDPARGELKRWNLGFETLTPAAGVQRSIRANMRSTRGRYRSMTHELPSPSVLVGVACVQPVAASSTGTRSSAPLKRNVSASGPDSMYRGSPLSVFRVIAPADSAQPRP